MHSVIHFNEGILLQIITQVKIPLKYVQRYYKYILCTLYGILLKKINENFIFFCNEHDIHSRPFAVHLTVRGSVNVSTHASTVESASICGNRFKRRRVTYWH